MMIALCGHFVCDASKTLLPANRAMRERLARREHSLKIPERPVHWPWLHGPKPSELAQENHPTEQPEMIERSVFPAKRSPDGYVAQRIQLRHTDHGPWVLTDWHPNGTIRLTSLTDDQVADWAPLYEAEIP